MSHSGSTVEENGALMDRGGTAADWLRRGWADLWHQPVPSLVYGLFIFALSWGVAVSLFIFDLSAYLFPALAGFLIIGPILALGLYDKSRRIENGEAVWFSAMIFVRPRSAAQLLLSGVFLCLLMLLWLRAAVVLYALFFGLKPFTGLDQIAPILFSTVEGWALLVIGSAVGGLFAALAFAISVFAIPMLFDRRTDVFTAMAISVRSVWGQMGRMLLWGVVVAALGAACLLSGFLLMIVVYPLLGHATWHAYRDACDLSLLD